MSKKKKQTKAREVQLDIEHNEEFTDVTFRLTADQPLSPQDCVDAIADTLLYTDLNTSRSDDDYLN